MNTQHSFSTNVETIVNSIILTSIMKIDIEIHHTTLVLPKTNVI